MRKSEKFKLRINMAMTLDGHTVLPSGGFNLGSTEDRRRMDKHRAWADYLIVSARTILAENPKLYIRTKYSSKQPIPLIIMNEFRTLPENLRIFSKPSVPGEIWYKNQGGTTEAEINAFTERTGFRVQKFSDISEIFTRKSETTNKYLLEGGGFLNGLFLAQDLVSDIFLTIVPYSFGGTTSDRPIVSKEYLPLQKYAIQAVEQRQDEIFIRYRKRSIKPVV